MTQKLIRENGRLYLLTGDNKGYISRDNAYNWLISQININVTPGMCLAIDYSSVDGVIAEARYDEPNYC